MLDTILPIILWNFSSSNSPYESSTIISRAYIEFSTTELSEWERF